jgi:hypothetical protein
LVRGTFDNGGPGDERTQSFPGVYPSDHFPPRTGSIETNSLGFTIADGSLRDSVYRHVQVFPHTAQTLVLNFTGSSLPENLTEGSWGIDSVKIYLVPEAGALEIRRVAMTVEGLRLEVLAAAGWSYMIEASPDLKDWQPLRTIPVEEVLTDFLDPNALTQPMRFYRIRRLP